MQNNDLSVRNQISPFSQEIQYTPLVVDFRQSTIATFEGKSYLQDHLDHFNGLMELYQVSKLAKFHCYAITLTKGIRTWFKYLEPKSILSWSNYPPFLTAIPNSQAILNFFHTPYTITYRVDELLKSYLKRFNFELSWVSYVPNTRVLAYLTSSVFPQTKF